MTQDDSDKITPAESLDPESVLREALTIKVANGSLPAIPILPSAEIVRNSNSSDLRYSHGNLLLTKMLREGLAELEIHRDRMLFELSEWSDQM